MSNTERFRELKKRLASIYEDAAQKEHERKIEEQREIEEEKLAHERELEEQRLADKNWELVKKQIINALEEANRVTLEGKAEISGWEIKNTGLHKHSTHVGSQQDDWGIQDYYKEHEHRSRIEAVELRLRGIGKIFLFRTLWCEERYQKLVGTWRREYVPHLWDLFLPAEYKELDIFEENDEYRKYFGIKWLAEPELNEAYSLPCYNCGRVENFSLLEPSDVEGCVSKGLTKIHELVVH